MVTKNASHKSEKPMHPGIAAPLGAAGGAAGAHLLGMRRKGVIAGAAGGAAGMAAMTALLRKAVDVRHAPTTSKRPKRETPYTTAGLALAGTLLGGQFGALAKSRKGAIRSAALTGSALGGLGYVGGRALDEKKENAWKRKQKAGKNKKAMVDIKLIRKLASVERGRRAFSALTTETSNPLDDVLLTKAASAQDPELFKLAMRMGADPMQAYEALGGKYKRAAFTDEDREGLHTVNNVAVLAPVGAALGGGLGMLRGRPGLGMGVGATIGGMTGLALPTKHELSERILKQAFGTPMFQSTPAAPDPSVQAAGASSPTAPSGPSVARPSASTGSQGSSAPSGAAKVQSIPEPSIPGASMSAGE